MKALGNILTVRNVAAVLTCVCANAWTWASEAETSARAAGGSGGSALATARYGGDVGFARTDTRTGQVSLARGVAVGVDERGLSLSVSLAIAPERGPALATNFNMSIGSNGDAAISTGRAAATGGVGHTVFAGGSTRATPYGAVATSKAGGSSRGGFVRANTRSDHYVSPGPAVRCVIRGW